MNKKILVLGVALMAVAMLATSVGGVLARPFCKDISVDKTYSMIYVEDHPELLVIDLRPTTMFAIGHILDAINIPYIVLGPPGTTQNTAVLNAWIANEGQDHLNDKIIVHCIGGITSPNVANMLIEAGFKKVYSMDGGFNAWVAAGYPH